MERNSIHGRGRNGRGRIAHVLKENGLSLLIVGMVTRSYIVILDNAVGRHVCSHGAASLLE